MTNSSQLFDFVPAHEPRLLVAARALARLLENDTPIDRGAISHALIEPFRGSDADGCWSVREAHAALELAQVLTLKEQSGLTPQVLRFDAFAAFDRLDALVPTQTARSEEQIELQQFATPPRLAWLAARAARIGPHDHVLEPSAGTGMLALWAEKTGARLSLNEFSPQRRECLEALFPGSSITGHDAELIDDLLTQEVLPSVVLMNPPYSHGIERGRDGRTGARHVRSAWKRLAPQGRLSAIMPEWFDVRRFRSSLTEPATLRLNAAIEGAFRKQGTGITTRLVVLDKVEGSTTFEGLADPIPIWELASLIDALPAQSCANSVHAPSTISRTSPVRLVASRPPSPLAPPVVSRPTQGIVPCAYQALAEPAPMAEQVGHYLPYRPSRVAIEGARAHPTPLVESVAMGSITAPLPAALPMLPGDLIGEGLLSTAQAETLIYAASAHERDLPGRFIPENEGCTLKPCEYGQVYRQGFFLGDGTGAGKGRQAASVILDRWVQGERRHIWISKNEALLEDARRDWAALGGLPIDIQPLSTWKLGCPVTMGEGILFVTYPTLRSGRGDATRLEQILDWAGDDFCGVIVFDEAHAMANAAGGEGSRGKVKGSEQGVAGVRLQNLLPRARVLYASATGASDVNNLAYATRLGLWGPETAFANREAFVADIRDGGIAAMELVARDLKALGLYSARALSFAGVEYEILEHALTPDQTAVYDAYADAWAIIHANLHEALEATRIVDGETGGTLNSGAKSAALSIFEGTKQRFFAQLLLSMKLPSLLPAIDAALCEGNAVVVQLVSTAEAMLNRRLADLTAEEREALEIDLSPREYV
jgi:hypothetical protein